MMPATVRRPWLTVVAVVPACLVPLACSTTKSAAPGPVTVTTEAPTTSAQSGGSSTTAASDSSVRPTPGSGVESFDASLTFGAGPFDLPDTQAGLADLSSYTATLTLTFNGTKAAQPDTWSTTTVMSTVKSPAARQLTVTKTGDVSDPAPVFMAEVNGATYEQQGQTPCSADTIAGDPTLGPQFEPAASLLPVIGADPADSETVNNTPADHYTFDERALGQSGRATSRGEVWVASTGGHVVKYLVTTKAGVDYFGDGVEGTITWDYQLTAINQPVVITLPADCPPGLIVAPQLPDATSVENLPGVLTYDTATSLADIVAFYQTELVNRGWVATDDPTIDEIGATITFTQANATLIVAAAIDAGVTTVQLLLA